MDGGIVGGILTSPAHLPQNPGEVGGVVLDSSGAVVSGARVSVTNPANGATMNAVTDASGRWIISNLSSGASKFQIAANGFNSLVQNFNYDASRPAEYVSNLSVATAAETVEVEAEAVNVSIHGQSAQFDRLQNFGKMSSNTASSNVVNLQRRVAGVLPVAIDVPRTGTSFQFARALVLDEETKVTFSYKSR